MGRTTPPLRVLLLAEDPLVRSGLTSLLAGRAEILVVGEGSRLDQVPAGDLEARPEVALVDLGWESVGNLASLEALADAGLTPVVLLTDPEAAGSAWAAGARGLLRREVDGDALAAALAAVAKGWAVVDPALAPRLLRLGDWGGGPLEEALTPREREVLQLLAEGLPNKGIARRLGVSEHTAKFHVNAILHKLGAQSRTEAVVRATRRGLLLL